MNSKLHQYRLKGSGLISISALLDPARQFGYHFFVSEHSYEVFKHLRNQSYPSHLLKGDMHENGHYHCGYA